MRVVFVVDSIHKINDKIQTVTELFGNKIIYICNAKFKKIFETYGFTANAIYSKNLSKVVHLLLSKTEIDDIVVYYSSLNLTKDLMKKFTDKIGNKTKTVNVIPKYNVFEQMDNGIYNVYVKSLFKTTDSMASPKLQFIPAYFVSELLNSHFANRMFELNPDLVSNIYIEDKEISKNLKVKTKFNKFNLIPIIVALFITMALFIGIAFIKVKYALILIIVFLYVLDALLALIFNFKTRFDLRFLK